VLSTTNLLHRNRTESRAHIDLPYHEQLMIAVSRRQLESFIASFADALRVEQSKFFEFQFSH
jgi:hypothetical protein